MDLVKIKMLQTVQDTHRELAEDENGPKIEYVTLTLVGGKEEAVEPNRAKKLVSYGYAELVEEETPEG